MYSYETGPAAAGAPGGTIVQLAHDPDRRAIVGTAVSPGGEPLAIELPCPYKPEDMGPHWIDYALQAAEQARLATNFPVEPARAQTPPDTGSKTGRQEAEA